MSEISPGRHNDASPCNKLADVAARTADSGPTPPQVIVVPASGRQTVLWVIAVLLAVIATALVGRWDAGLLSSTAVAQYAPAAGPSTVGARGIYAFTGQLGLKNYGLFMMDVDTGTVWCYEMARGRDNDLQLQLVAARSWIFDRFLEEFNVARPTPGEVQVMVRQQQGNAAAAVPLANPGAGSPSGPATSTPAMPQQAPVAPLLPDDDKQK